MHAANRSPGIGALHGIRVLDLSRVLAGPWASQLLADYGADVIKVERPGSGDDTRHWGPPWLADQNGEPTDDSAYYLATNRNKRSITIDLASSAGQAVARDLAARSDVLIENFRVGTARRFGLDAESLHELHPGLIYCSISAYGQSGSRADLPGYDAMIQASAGLMSLTGPAEGEGGGPQRVGVAIADIMTGMYAASAILAALVARGAGRSGQYIDLSLYDTQVAALANQAMNYLVTGKVPVRFGTGHPNIVPYQAFATADGYLSLAVGNDGQFAACCRVIGHPDLPADARFADNASRVEHREELIGIMSAAFAERSTDQWLEALREAGVPAGPINDLARVFSEPFARERELVRKLEHPLAGTVDTVANPVRFSATPVEYRRAPPLLGQHTEELLREMLGYTQEKIESLREAGAI